MTDADQALRGITNPLYSQCKLKLGTFGTNINNAIAFTTVDERFRATWPDTLAVARLADDMFFEAIVPVARWKGFGGASNTGGESFETYTWAAGLGALTENSCVLATSHIPTVHPLMAAKHATTIDHITNGRFALNIVCGWVKDELELFGSPLMESDEAYDYAAEWVEVVRKLWTTEGEFDHHGKYFQMRGACHDPKPIQQPFPALMNAGSSPKGQHFAAKYCDMAFIQQKERGMASLASRVKAFRQLAWREYQRDIQVWSYAYVVQAQTEREAREYLQHYAGEYGDRAGALNIMRARNPNLDENAADVKQLLFEMTAGWNGYPLVGTKEQVAQALWDLSEAGLDGCLLGWVDFEAGMRQFQRDTLPLLKQLGLR